MSISFSYIAVQKGFTSGVHLCVSVENYTVHYILVYPYHFVSFNLLDYSQHVSDILQCRLLAVSERFNLFLSFQSIFCLKCDTNITLTSATHNVIIQL